MNQDTLDWAKTDGLIPAIVQDADNLRVLMLGYMDKAALDKTRQTGKVTFFSRSKQRLWTKGEESGHILQLVEIKTDCDNDTLLPSRPDLPLIARKLLSRCPGQHYLRVV